MPVTDIYDEDLLSLFSEVRIGDLGNATRQTSRPRQGSADR